MWKKKKKPKLKKKRESTIRHRHTINAQKIGIDKRKMPNVFLNEQWCYNCMSEIDFGCKKKGSCILYVCLVKKNGYFFLCQRCFIVT